MIQGFRPPHWLACAALAAAALAPTASAYAGPLLAPARHAAAPVPALALAPAPAPPDGPYEELAGSLAGVGRERPGRPVGEPADPELTVASRPLPVRPRTEPTPPPDAAVPSPHPPLPLPPQADPQRPPSVVTALGTDTNDRAADLAAHILPLGTGFALMGLGLGYLGMRLRRSI
ncbi:hypothetical protein [Streptomyces avidinii]|uniref:Uncharacterized protein n=1 Tax=Streptomyces avidinii TaxID=1895 RepID=A0ABS4LFC6_STRAV|nr:hypothetical protein [Streptomyces avidinii]MBP2040812.1 hypothetical protein [Streptomyces avidinii]GGZ15774.1 hypothetical protein GCM10010343_48350 [Streptomyces avidinii]